MARNVEPRGSIGKRAAQAIRKRAAQNGTFIKEELERIDACSGVFFRWERRVQDPSAYFIRQMLLEGYDVIWILTGGSNGDSK